MTSLIVCPTNRGPAIAGDLLDALRWSCHHPFHLILVDDHGDLGPLANDQDCHVVPGRLARDKRYSGFKAGEGLQYGLRRQLEFDLAWLLDDDALPTGPGLDAWAAQTLEAADAGLLGVEDRMQYADQWPAWRDWFSDRVPEAAWYAPPPQSAFFASIWLDPAAVRAMDRRGLLVPRGYTQWTLWPDVYWSWVVGMLGYPLTFWGSMRAPRAPLYLNHPDMMESAPQPWILKETFLMYHSTRAVPLHGEDQVRAHYQQARHGTAVPSTPSDG